jgi:hypothetical protein
MVRFPRALRVSVRHHGRRQPLRGPGHARRLPHEVRGAVRAAARRGCAVLCGAREPRRPQGDQLRALQHAGTALLPFCAAGNLLARITTPVAFFALDSTYLDSAQLAWFDAELAASPADWKIVFLHHPIYTSGRYRASAFVNRSTLESIFLRRHVSVVFSGHEHIYQRTTLQNGIQYFISGGAGSLRPGDGTPAPFIARTYSADYHFMLVEIEGDALNFQAISRTGATIDAGRLRRDAAPHETRTLTRADTAAPH